MRSDLTSLLVLFAAATSQAQQVQWGQCGGIGWTGPLTCINGWDCVWANAWFSQCLPGTSTSSSLPATTTTTRTTTRPTTTTTTRSGTRTTTTATATGGGYPGATLLSGYYWIRAVAAPHFHEYLQSPGGTAVIASHTTAGQFQIVSGQLVQTTASGLLYANVEQRSNATDMLLGVAFTTSQNTFGAFSWSGDALQWNVASITRPNPSAWYVCGSNNQLFINLGQYLYGTPAGCSDQTIHFYNGATADL